MESPKPQGCGQFRDFQFPRKVSLGHRKVTNFNISVPQTDTGGLVENTKANGRKRFKELGKLAGRNLWEMPYPEQSGSQQKTLTGCLTKTQVSAKPKGNV